MRVTDEMVEALRALLLSAKVLHQNAEGCTVNHYGSDFEIHGLPGWLAECQRDIKNGETALAALEAALAVEGTPKVKALEWEGDGHWHSMDDDGWMEEANTPFGWGYSVEFGQNGDFKVDSTFEWSAFGFETPDAAKAAAQADYEKRVLSCLEYTTPPAGIREALKDAETWLEGLLEVFNEMPPETAHEVTKTLTKLKAARAALRGQS